MLPGLLLPLFLLTALGSVLARPRVLAASWPGALAELTGKLFIPAFLFSGAFRNGMPAAASWQFLAAFFVPLLLLFVLAAWGPGRGPASAARALAATYSNTVFVGVPVLVQAFGPDSLRYAFPVIAFHGLTAFTLYYLAAPAAGGGLLAALANTLRNPIVLSLLAGLAGNALQLTLPAPLATVLAWLAGAALPCALLALGAQLATLRLRQLGASSAIVAAKLVLLPAGVLAMATLVFQLPAPACAVLVVLAACPVGVNGAALVQADGQDASLVSSAILLSSILCMLTLPAWVALARSL